MLPDLIAGKPVTLDGHEVQLAPGVSVPPILVGGLAEAALTRTVVHGAGWFGLPLPPEQLVAVVDRLRDLATAAGRATPAITGSAMVALDGDPTVPGDDAIARILADPDGLFGMPPEAVPGMVLRTPEALAERLAMWSALGAERVVLTIAAGQWLRQADLIAGATGRAHRVPSTNRQATDRPAVAGETRSLAPRLSRPSPAWPTPMSTYRSSVRQ